MSVFSTDRLPALKIAISASMSLAVMIVDFVWLIRDEVNCLWPKIRYSWYARFYMLSRYIGMASQIFNVYFTLRAYCGIPTSPAGCSIWFAYQVIILQFLLVSAEGVLMYRVYALFLRSRIILLILVMFAVGQATSLVVSACLAVPNLDHAETCIIPRSNPGSAYFGATTMTTNTIVFFMTFWRYLHLPAKWTQQGLGWVVIRDSALSILAISIVLLFMTLCVLQIIRLNMSGNIIYYWLVCVLWVSIGRTIVNHEKLPREDRDLGGSTWRSTLQLTSRIELGEISAPSSDGAAGQESSPRSSVCTTDTVWPRNYQYQTSLNGASRVGLGSEPPSAV